MKNIINSLYKLNTESKSSMLVTIVKTHGSSPRGANAHMVVSHNGYVCGTIGGGMLEYKAIELAKDLLVKKQGLFKEYVLRAEETAELGMICGGNVDVLFTYISKNKENSELLYEISSCIIKKEVGYLVLELNGSKINFYQDEKMLPINSNDYYIEKIGLSSKVYIFGGGHLAQALVPVISNLGFHCIVTDDRIDFATKTLFPQAEEVIVSDYKELQGKYNIEEQDYIIIVTRGHLGDFHVQEFALKTNAFYIGVVGSKTKIATVNSKLIEAGFTKDDINRITSPIGLNIKSETPEEIAISIAAQLILLRATRHGK